MSTLARPAGLALASRRCDVRVEPKAEALAGRPKLDPLVDMGWTAGATVKDHPEQVSRISRSDVNDQVTPERPASPETRQHMVPSAGIEPATPGLGNRCSLH